MNNEFMTLREFCENYRISASTAYRMIRNGQLPAQKIGKCWKISKAVLQKYSDPAVKRFYT